jgi:hypothetical protein
MSQVSDFDYLDLSINLTTKRGREMAAKMTPQQKEERREKQKAVYSQKMKAARRARTPEEIARDRELNKLDRQAREEGRKLDELIKTINSTFNVSRKSSVKIEEVPDGYCVHCLKEKATIKFYPCLHLCLCKKCNAKVKGIYCPICG